MPPTPNRPVPAEAVLAVARRFGLPDPARAAHDFAALLEALAQEPDPPTTVRDPMAALDVHVADSLVGLEVPELRAAVRISDLGAGAGFPGLALAVALRSAHVDLVESQRRKCEVIERLAAATSLSARVRAVLSRAEDWASGDGAHAYGAVTARALGPLAVICEYAAPLLYVGGVLVAWKGARDPAEEKAGAGAATEVGLGPPKVVAVTPYEGSRNRHLHVYSKVRETPERFPRRAGMASKRPLA